jgi:hypothetical protein
LSRAHRFPARRLLFVSLVTAVLLRAFAWAQKAVLFDDGPLFLAMAKAIRAGDFEAVLGHPYHPLYSIGVAFGTVLGLPPEAAAVSLSIGCAAAAVVFLFLFLRDAFGEEIAAIGAFLFAIHPRAVDFGSDVQSDSLYMALFLGCVFGLFRCLRSPRCRTGVFTGVGIGLAFWTRPEGLGLVVVGLLLLVGHAFGGTAQRKKVVATALALVLGTILVVAPYVLAIQSERGEWMLTPKRSFATLLPFVEAPASAGGLVAGQATPTAVRVIGAPAPPRAIGAASATDTPSGSWETFVEWFGTLLSAFRYDVVLLLGVGLWQCRGRPGMRGVFLATIAIFYAAVLLGLASSAGYVSRRHALVPLLPLLGYAAMGVTGLAEALRRALPQAAGTPARRGLCIGVVLAVVTGLALPADLAPRRQQHAALRAAAEWIEAGTLREGALATGRLRNAYYAGRRFEPLPAGSRALALARLRRRGVAYVLVAEKEIRHLPWLEPLDTSLRLVHRAEERGEAASVFEFIGSR